MVRAPTANAEVGTVLGSIPASPQAQWNLRAADEAELNTVHPPGKKNFKLCLLEASRKRAPFADGGPVRGGVSRASEMGGAVGGALHFSRHSSR